jgi:hypothetical protein
VFNKLIKDDNNFDYDLFYENQVISYIIAKYSTKLNAIFTRRYDSALKYIDFKAGADIEDVALESAILL